MTCRLGVVMDPIAGITVKKDTTLALLLAAQARSYTLYYFEQRDLFLHDGRPYGRARLLEVRDDSDDWFTFHDERKWNQFIEGKQVSHRYGDHDFPLYSMGLFFDEGLSSSIGNSGNRRSALLFRSAEASAALHVDAILGSQEIIVKPLGPQLLGIPGLSGATVLSDGRVVIVLELASLVRQLGARTPQSSDIFSQAQIKQLRRAKQSSQRIKAMVIDDSITIRKITARTLERQNIDSVLAKDGVEALGMLEQGTPDIIILDIEMPRMDGFEVAAHIRKQARLQHVPILMITSRSGEKHRERAAKLGVDDYLIKPYQEDELMAALYRLLKQRRDSQTKPTINTPAAHGSMQNEGFKN